MPTYAECQMIVSTAPELNGNTGFRTDVSICAGIQRLAAAVGRQHGGTHKHGSGLPVHGDIDAAGQARGAAAMQHGSVHEMGPHKGRRAGRVDADRWALPHQWPIRKMWWRPPCSPLT